MIRRILFAPVVIPLAFTGFLANVLVYLFDPTYDHEAAVRVFYTMFDRK